MNVGEDQGSKIAKGESGVEVTKEESVDNTMAEGQPIPPQELKEKVEAFKEQREADVKANLKEMEQHPRCILLSSPEMLDLSMNSRGSDKTNTLEDLALVRDWVAKKGLLNVGFYQECAKETLEESEFGALVKLAYKNGFDAMRNTASPDGEELVFWYYAGHGLGKDKAENLTYSSTPCLEDDYNAVNYLVEEAEGRKVKGGELCLHQVGFCGLHGLLKPWIAAVKLKSINAIEGAKKKNKHLVIILDSCHSGILANDLQDFIKHVQGKEPSLLEENSITIQAACGPDELTDGGYFTPCFIYLNQEENYSMLQDWKNEWSKMTPEKKEEYELEDLPSPMVVTTRDQSQEPTMEVAAQNFKVELFQDAGFFKFCFIKFCQLQDEQFPREQNDRALNAFTARDFMKSQKFNVLDYKLKIYKTAGPYQGTPLGLFLLEDPKNAQFAICAHIHFKDQNINKPSRINLVHHRKPRSGAGVFFYTEELPKEQIILDGSEKQLVKACHDYVTQHNGQGTWADVSKWNMKKSFKNLFRLKERSAWENNYLKYIEQFDLPKVQ